MAELSDHELDDMAARASRYPKVRDDVARLVAEVRRLRAAPASAPTRAPVAHELELSEQVGTEQK